MEMSQLVTKKTVSVPVGEYQSKYEVYNLLTVKAKVYLCEPKCLTIFFLKEIASGEKQGKKSLWQ
jgi:hypothetical protein